MNLIVALLKKQVEKEVTSFLEDFWMGKEMVNGFSGMTMGRLKFRESTTVVKNMVNGHYGTLMANQKSREHLVLGKLIAFINTGLIMGTSKRSKDIKKICHTEGGQNGIKKTPLLNMLKMETGNIRMACTKMKIMNCGAGGGILMIINNQKDTI